MLLQKPAFVINDFFLFSKETEQGCTPHFHKFAEILFSGENTLDVHAGMHEPHHLKPHEMLVIPPEQVHSVITLQPGVSYQLLQIDLNKLFLLFSPCPYGDYINLLFSENISNFIYRGTVVEEITDIFSNIQNKFEIKYISDLINIINLINKHTPNEVINSDNNLRRLKFYSTLNELIESEPMDNLHLDYLSKKFYMSKSTFQRLVKKCTGLSFHAWLQKCKMQQAVIHLRKNVPVSEIALNLGFSSPSHFCKTFKTYYGITPKESRSNSKLQYDRPSG